MHSRAYLILENERTKMETEPAWGTQAKPLNEDDMFIWEASVKGLKDTVWEGGIFKLYLKFFGEYNIQPPEVYFHTIPFHPNVDMNTGRPCIDFLDDQHQWKEGFNIQYILLSIQAMLANPVLENAVNVDALDTFINTPGVYRQMVLDCVLASKRIEAGLKPHVSEIQISPDVTKSADKSPPKSAPSKPRTGPVSFEDYHSVWAGIATSKPLPQSKNPLNDILRSDPNLHAAHFGLHHEELSEEITKQVSEHNAMMYGNFGKKNTNKDDLAELKATKLQLLKKIYLPKQPNTQATSTRPNTEASTSIMVEQDFRITASGEPQDDEVDDLIAWSNTLPNTYQLNL